MKPRFENTSTEYKQLMKQATELEERLAKSQPGYDSQKEGSEVGVESFMTQSAGKDNVRNAFYNTNNVVPEVEDVTNKGATSENSDVLDKNPFYPTADSTDRLVDVGGEGPVMKSLGGDIEKFRLQEIRKSMDNISSRIN